MTEKIPTSEPLRPKPKGCLPMVGVIVSVLFLLNLTAGIVELPDNIPIIGNLDEVFFSGLLFYCLSLLGVRLPGGRRRVSDQAT